MSDEAFETTSEWDSDEIKYQVSSDGITVSIPYFDESDYDGMTTFPIALTKAEAEDMRDALNRCLEQFNEPTR